MLKKTIFFCNLQIRQKLGGRIRFILSGSAPVSPDVMDFMRICFSAKVYEGYGQTENYCGGCLVKKQKIGERERE